MKATQQAIVICMAGLLVVYASGPIQGQTAGGNPDKWIQPPDLTSLGLDVNATNGSLLADDFNCTSTGPITNIKVWGSWLGDYLPYSGDAAMSFRLQIYGDIPADPNNPQTWSTPAATVLWERMFYSTNSPTTFTAEPYYTIPEDEEGEGWYNPYTAAYLPDADHTIWLYNFDIPTAEAFVQQGSADTPIVYWLALEAFVDDVEAQFGWKTSLDHWNDDAVWTLDDSVLVWNELRYPYGHEYEGQSIDLAFAIAPEPITLAMLALGMVAAGLQKRRQRSL
ncbi:MAG: PEP-CTERM sorting domain-containing protein [Actinobacteria bacterium]|nr:PEP-CTERM sorting domain-containing protein [Actinomycetota bacterium]